jgi:hypothetical protein
MKAFNYFMFGAPERFEETIKKNSLRNL